MRVLTTDDPHIKLSNAYYIKAWNRVTKAVRIYAAAMLHVRNAHCTRATCRYFSEQRGKKWSGHGLTCLTGCGAPEVGLPVTWAIRQVY